MELHSALCRNDLATPRRFEEIADEGLRGVFASHDLIVVASWLVGYLDEAGKILGRTIIDVDAATLAEGWRELGPRLERDSAHITDWSRLPVDLERWSRPQRGRRPAAAAVVAANLRRSTRLAGDGAPDPDLDRWADEAGRRAEQSWHGANEIWQELRGGGLAAGPDPVAARLRASGLTFVDGMRLIETIAQGPIEPGTQAPAQP
jgi:hypothetical protein